MPSFFLLDAPLISYLALIDFFEIILSPFCKQTSDDEGRLSELYLVYTLIVHTMGEHVIVLLTIYRIASMDGHL